VTRQSSSLNRRVLPWCLAVALSGIFNPVSAQPDSARKKPAVASVRLLSLNEMVLLLRQSNKDILTRKSERDIAATGIDRAAAAFQPMATLSLNKGNSRQPNTYEEKLSRSQQNYYERDGKDYSVGVSKLLPTGAKLEAKTTLSRFITNINELQQGRPPDVQDNRSYWGVTVTQPLARDAGIEVTQARTKMAELDLAVADFTSAETEVSVVADAAMAYYDLVLAQQRVTVAEEKIVMGRRLLREAKALLQRGRLPEADLWELENSLARFQSGLSEARQGERERANRLSTLLMLSADDGSARFRASDPWPEAIGHTPTADAGLKLALESRHDFLMQKSVVEREGVQLVYANNQALPRIDLVASYGRSGLAYSASNSFQGDLMSQYPTWSVGFQVSVPLGRNQQGQADVQSAVLRRENALLALKALEVQIANDIDTSLNLCNSAAERWNYWTDISQKEKMQLNLERKRFVAGRSTVREILQREERAVNANLMLIEQKVAYAKAQIILESAQGVLLQRWPS